jgi:hypothetical protein
MVGLAGLVIGMLDPLEGAIVAFASAAMIAAGAQLAESRFRRPLYLAVGMIGAGLAIMIGLSAAGGVGGDTGRSIWWLLLLLPYPAGWLMAVVFGVRKLRERLP